MHKAVRAKNKQKIKDIVIVASATLTHLNVVTRSGNFSRRVSKLVETVSGKPPYNTVGHFRSKHSNALLFQIDWNNPKILSGQGQSQNKKIAANKFQYSC